MKNFRRAVRDSLHHWPMLVMATLCSMGVATLWSANIGAMFPVIQMTLDGESAQKYLGRAVDATQATYEKQTATQQSLNEKLLVAGDPLTLLLL